MNAPSLRERFGGLVGDYTGVRPGKAHRQLLTVLKLLDDNMSFCSNQRNGKYFFWQDLKQSIQASHGLDITLKHIQQLLFLDDTLFCLEWSKNISLGNRLDLLFRYLGGEVEAKVRRTESLLVEYLRRKEREWREDIEMRGDAKKTSFDPNIITIPLG